MAQEALEVTAADLEVAQATGVMRIELGAATAIGEQRAFGDGVEGGDSHDEAVAIDLDGVAEWARLPVPASGLVVTEARFDVEATAVLGKSGTAVGLGSVRLAFLSNSRSGGIHRQTRRAGPWQRR